MKDKEHILDQIFIAAPCSVDFESLKGSSSKRFCHGCQKSVYNLSEITLKEGERLLKEKGDSACLLLSRDNQGKVITKDRKQRCYTLNLAKKVVATIFGLFLVIPSALSKENEPTEPKGNNKKTPEKNKTLQKSRPAKIKVNNQPIAPGRVCIPTTINTPANTKPDNKPKIKPFANHSKKQSNDFYNLDPSWLKDKRANEIAREWPERFTEGNADKRAFVLYQLARHHEARGNTSFATAAYKKALELTRGKKSDPKFRETIEKQYNQLQMKLSQ